MQFSGNKGNQLHCDSHNGLHLSLCLPNNHEESLQLVSRVWLLVVFVIWFSLGLFVLGSDFFALGCIPRGP